MTYRIKAKIEQIIIALTTRRILLETIDWNEPKPEDPDFYPYFWA